MVRETQDPSDNRRKCLIVGNYCHDVLIKDDVVIAESLGGAVSFISAVLDGVSVPSDYISKVGPDFAYAVNHRPVISLSSNTTVFHAYFSSEINRHDRVLKRVGSCDPIGPSDLPACRYDFGLAVGVGGEIIPETLEQMIDMCRLVFADIQALIRVFDPLDGTVKLVNLKDTAFYKLLPKISFLKASSEEAAYLDVEDARRWCCVVVTNGKDGCTLYWKDVELQIAPFTTVQIDPTGAGDSFLGGLVAGLVQGLAVPDAALLGNFFGSLTVGQIGLPKFDLRLLQNVKDEVQRRSLQCVDCHENQDDELRFVKPNNHEEFHAVLCAAKLWTMQRQQDLSSPVRTADQRLHHHCADQEKLVLNNVYEEPINLSESNR